MVEKYNSSKYLAFRISKHSKNWKNKYNILKIEKLAWGGGEIID